jgi:hypothetical protein
MRRIYLSSRRWGWCIGLGVLIAQAMPFNATAQGPFGSPDADPIDAFGAPPNVTICPSTKPFRCEAGNCVTNPTKCKQVPACPEDKPYRCSDGRCVGRTRDCGYGILSPREER